MILLSRGDVIYANTLLYVSKVSKANYLKLECNIVHLGKLIYFTKQEYSKIIKVML